MPSVLANPRLYSAAPMNSFSDGTPCAFQAATASSTENVQYGALRRLVWCPEVPRPHDPSMKSYVITCTSSTNGWISLTGILIFSGAAVTHMLTLNAGPSVVRNSLRNATKLVPSSLRATLPSSP